MRTTALRTEQRLDVASDVERVKPATVRTVGDVRRIHLPSKFDSLVLRAVIACPFEHEILNLLLVGEMVVGVKPTLEPLEPGNCLLDALRVLKTGERSLEVGLVNLLQVADD